MPVHPQSIIGSILGSIWKLITWPFRMVWKLVTWIVSSLIHLILLVYRGIKFLLSTLWNWLPEFYRDNLRCSVQALGVGCLLLFIVLTALLILLSPFYAVPLIGTDLVLKSRTTYTLSCQSFSDLNEEVKKDKLPRKVWTSLRDLKDTAIKGENEFLAAVSEQIGEGYAKKYKTLILENALPSFTLTQPALDRLSAILPEQVVNSLKPLKGRQLSGEGEFLDTLQNQIGEAVVNEHKEQLLGHARNLAPTPRYTLNEKSFNDLVTWTKVPLELLDMLRPLQGQTIVGREHFLDRVQAQLGEETRERYRDLFLRYTRSGIFELNSETIAKLKDEGFDEGALEKFSALWGEQFEGRDAFFAELETRSGRKLSAQEKRQLSRHSELPPFLDESSFEQFRCEELPDYIMDVLEASNLKNKNFIDENTLLMKLGEALGKGLTERYENSLVFYAHYAEPDLKARGLENESFLLSKESMEVLAKENLSTEAMKGLRALQNEEILGEEAFLRTLKAQVGKEALKGRQALILEYAHDENWTLNADSFRDLGSVATRIEHLEGMTFVSKWGFLNAISEFLGVEDTRKFGQNILQQTLISLTVDETILKNLREQQLPERLLESLETLKPIEVIGEEAFIKMLQDCTGEKALIASHRASLLNESSFTLTRKSLDDLGSLSEIPPEDLALLETLRDRDFKDETELLQGISATLGERETERHRSLILEEVEKSYPILRFELMSALKMMGQTLAGTEGLFIVSCLALFLGLALLAFLAVTTFSFLSWFGERIDFLTSSRIILLAMFVVTMSVLLVLAVITGHISLS